MLDNIHPLIATLIANRNIKDLDVFLSPDYALFSDPYLMHDMDRAVKRILSAITSEESIMIYADYDADGVPGAVVLKDFFDRLGYDKVSVYIPHRHNEGYGLHAAVIEKAAHAGVKLFITIDLGVTAIDQVALANSLGMEVIITDHHEPKDTLPEAFAIVNPKLGTYPDPMLCGAAVVFQLVRAMIAELRKKPADEKLSMFHDIVTQWPEGVSKWWLDLVGLSTISDMVPLVGENRILAHFGLRVFRKTRRPGLRALAKETRLLLSHTDEKDIGFSITPRINAASRMSHAMDAFAVLAASDEVSAKDSARHLSRLNDQRKRVTAKIMKQVRGMLKKRTIREVVVIGHPEWSVGVLSIVAGKLSEEFQRPVFVWTTHGTHGIKGSCRAPGGLSVLDLMNGAEDYFVKFGGHQAAGGFLTDHDHIHTLEQKLVDVFRSCYAQWKPVTGVQYKVDLSVDMQEVDRVFYQDMRKLAPFGMGNPEPVFEFKQLRLVSVRQFGKHDDHLEVIVSDTHGRTWKAVSFYTDWKNMRHTPLPGVLVNVIGRLEMNRFLGANELRISLVEVVPA